MKRTPQTVRSQGIRALFEQGAAVLWANVGVSLLVVGTLWSDVPRDRLLCWLAAVLAVSVTRAALQRSYRRTQPGDDTIEAWGRRFVFGSVAAGLVWGSAGLLFFVERNALSQSLLTFTIGGMTAAAAGTLSCHLPAFFGFFICALAPLCFRAFAEGDRVHLGMGAMLLAYAAGMQYVARNNHAALTGAFRLALEKAELSQRLSTSQIELEETNRTLELRVVERTRALEEQGEALRQAQRLEVAGRLAGGLAHDFNSLLTVITDVVMPGLTGLQLARQLLLVRPTLGVLFISGYTFEETVPDNDLATRTAYLPKPFDTKVLTSKVHELLQG